MRVDRALVIFVAGLAGGTALILSAPLAASDPPAKAQPAHDEASAHASHGPSNHVTPLAVPGPEIGFRGCAYFENGGFAGRRADMPEGANMEWVGAAWNDRISSIACADGCRLIGYENVNYGGARRNFTGAVAEAGAAWDDKISALRVVCASDSAHGSGHEGTPGSGHEAASPEPH